MKGKWNGEEGSPELRKWLRPAGKRQRASEEAKDVWAGRWEEAKGSSVSLQTELQRKVKRKYICKSLPLLRFKTLPFVSIPEYA